MFEPKLTDPHPESEKIHSQKIHCSVHDCEATVVVANWPFSEEGWSDWRVIDCSILPPGALRCGMDCLSQVRLNEK